MHRLIALAAVALLAPSGAHGQTADETIYLEPEQPLEFNLTVEAASGTEEIICYQDPLEPIEVGSAQVSASGEAVVPISIPDPVVRCTACNQFGCSEFSPNSGVIAVRQAHLFDINNDGMINVADVLDWSRAVYGWIMSHQSAVY